jgi:DNA-binding transcriptional regulator LsrR (DeoR family)
VLSVEDWAEIRRLHFAEGLGIKTIAKRLGVARNTVRIAVRSGNRPHIDDREDLPPSIPTRITSEHC